MKVIVAEHLGMCFGVRHAIEATQRVSDPHQVTIHGELVHNDQVLAALLGRGFSMQTEQERNALPQAAGVLVTAHGISDRQRERLVAAGKTLLDTTCPLVRRAHRAARLLEEKGYFVVVIGKPGHVEVEGLVGDLSEFEIISHPAQARHYGRPRLGVMCQTTTAPTAAEHIRQAIAAANPQAEIRFVDTICHPTKARQQAVLDLLPQVQALVVVGGKNSNNTNKLGELAEAAAVPWFRVETAAEVDPLWANRYNVMGLTAGTSTPDEVVREVHARLAAFAEREEMLAVSA